MKLYFQDKSWPPLIFLVPNVEHLKKREIMLFTKYCMGCKGFGFLYVSCCTVCYYSFNPCGIFEKVTSFSPIFNQDLKQGKLTAPVTEFSEIEAYLVLNQVHLWCTFTNNVLHNFTFFTV